MLFNTFVFWIFFAALWSIVSVIPKERKLGVFLGASLVFYSLWVPVYLVLLLGTITLNYALLRAMQMGTRPRLYLTLSVAGTLALLAYYKYAAFLLESAIPVLQWMGLATPNQPNILLPLGISFYSFQIIGVAIDSYRGHLEPVRSLRRYTLFVCFFPQLIAGPIVRGGELLPQIKRGAAPTPERNRRGVWLIACGLFKKVVLADFFLAPFVNIAFGEAARASAPILLTGAYSFSFQIYFDFSGYSDIARGLALLLGFELPFNFKEPYLSRNPSEFWRRWHITLSSWFRDYLYIPLGGNRRGASRTAINLLVTMLLGGLWHGASWTFVAWGALHGILLVFHRPFSGAPSSEDAPWTSGDVGRAILMFHFVCLFWIFFRADSIEIATEIVAQLIGGDYTLSWPLFHLAIVALCIGLHPLERYARRRASVWRDAAAKAAWAPFAEAAGLGILLALCLTASSGGEFIYFQF